jgi:hypothetical protein
VTDDEFDEALLRELRRIAAALELSAAAQVREHDLNDFGALRQRLETLTNQGFFGG